MCGIAGIISSNKLNINQCEGVVRRTLDKIGHRGPDYRGIVSYQASSWNICLGMNRLAIIDLTDTGNQPMRLDNLTIVYNGEVYNYLELKEDLIKRGHKFKGNSDTEVVLHAFKEWGVDCVRKFIGMFAIAIFDKIANKLHLIRDRVGEKPLYYYFDNNVFFFSSEMKGILTHNFVNKDLYKQGIFNYLIFNSVSPPVTIFQNIKQVMPGYVLEVSVKEAKFYVDEAQYWNFPELIPDFSLTEAKVISNLEKLLYDSIKVRLRSDVPLGIFLSGGIDSALIASLASEISAPIKTFTIGYADKKHDESTYAEFVSRHIKSDHSTIMLDENMANLDFSELAYISDDCLANLSIIPYYTLAKKTCQNVKVVLSGDGGDEFFCGYSRSYGIIAKFFRYKNIAMFFSKIFGFNKYVSNINRILCEVDSLCKLVGQYVIRDKIKVIKDIFNQEGEELNIYRRIDVSNKISITSGINLFWVLNYYEGGGNYLTDTVLKTTDRVSMYHSLEARSVFTDHRIIEYMARVPDKFILKKGVSKYLLKKILTHYLPHKFVFSRSKKGFSVPLTTDYQKQWQKAVREAREILMNIRNDFFDLSKLKVILGNDRYHIEFQSHVIFLAFFMKRWQINCS